MNLTDYAAHHGIGYRAAWNRFKAGKIDGAFQDEYGRIQVPDLPADEARPGNRVAVYARVSTHKQRDDLERQAIRLVEFANARGLEVVAVVKEVASGVNDNRPKLAKLLRSDEWDVLVVEHKDRLSRVGFGWFDLFVSEGGRTIVVANSATEETADLMDDFVSIIYSFSARLYGLRSARRRTDRALAALKDPSPQGADA